MNTENKISKDEIIVNIIHELKTPIATIYLVSQTLRNNFDDIGEINYFDIIDEECSTMSNLLDRLIMLNKIEDPKIQFDNNINIHDVLTVAVNSMKATLKGKKGILTEYYRAEHFIVKGNGDLLISAFRNIIQNSIIYCNTVPEITITTYNENNDIVLLFSDNGIGIEEKYYDKVFDKYYKIPDKKHVDGTGLGLYYVNKNIRRLGGSVVINSCVGKGTTLKITLPICLTKI